MNEHSERQSGIVVVFVLVLTLGLGLVVYEYLALSSTSRQIADAHQTLTETARTVKKNAAWQNNYESLSKRLGTRAATASWSEQMSPMVTRLSGIFESHHARMETLQPEPMVIIDQVAHFPLRISLNTDLPHLTGILHDIRSAVPMLKIEQLDIRNDLSNLQQLKVEMTVATFVVLEKTTKSAKKGGRS